MRRFAGFSLLWRVQLFFTFLTLAVMGVSGQQYPDFPGEGEPGEVLIIPVEGGEQTIQSISLMDGNDKAVSTGQSFDLHGMETVLLALPSTIAPGDYLLRASTSGEGPGILSSFQVLPRDFRQENIELNGDLTIMRTSEEEKKRLEALEIQALYALFNPQSEYSGLSFNSPIDFTELEYFRISSEYGERRIFHYSDDRKTRAVHTGIDMAAERGVEVRAAADGRIVLAKERFISGLSIVIEHLPGVYSIYFHLDSIYVRPGDLVKQDQTIGEVGMSGLATGPHLHWEIRVNGIAVDPRPLTQNNIPDTIQPTSIGE